MGTSWGCEGSEEKQHEDEGLPFEKIFIWDPPVELPTPCMFSNNGLLLSLASLGPRTDSEAL